MSDLPEQPPSGRETDRPVRRARWASQPLVSVELEKGRLAEGLAARLAELIETGVWAEGMKLPSTRTLAKDHGISRNTAIAALGILATEGLIETRDRSVAHVLPRRSKAAARSAPPPRPEEAITAFDIGSARRWRVPERAAMERRLWQASDAILAEAPVQGLEMLRREIGHTLLGSNGLRVPPERLIVTETNLESLRLILAARVDPVRLVLDQHAFDAAQAAALAELLHRPVARRPGVTMSQGEHRDGLAFLTSPPLRRAHGQPMRAAERKALLAWAERGENLLIERDEDWAVLPPAPARRPPLAAASDAVIHLTCFGRMISPELPLASMACPAHLVADLVRIRSEGRGAINAALQLWLATYLRDGHLGPHLRRRAAAMAELSAALARAARASFGTVAEIRPSPHRDSLVLRIAADPAEQLAACLRASGFWVAQVEDGLGGSRLQVTTRETDADDGRIATAMAAAARLFAAG